MKRIFNQKGFTLVEVLASVSIFLILSIAIINIFVSTIKIQQHVLSISYLIDQSNYSLQYLSRQIRDAEGIEVEGGIITIIDNAGIERKILLDNGVIKFDDKNLTARDIQVEHFEIVNFDGDSEYKSITFYALISKDDNSLVLQRTVSLRNP